MKTSLITKTLFPFLAAMSFCFEIPGQNCSSVSAKTDKQKGVVTVGGVTTSKDFYSLLIQKEKYLSDTYVAPRYILYLNAASRVSLSDSMLKTSGSFAVQLLNGSNITYPDVAYHNNPFGPCCSLGFKTYLTEEQIKTILDSPIITISVVGILTTSFSEKKQKEQQKIIGCLITKN